MTSHERHGISNHRQLDCLDSSYKIPAMRNWCVFLFISLGEHLSGVGSDLMRHELKKICMYVICMYVGSLCYALSCYGYVRSPIISHVCHFALLVSFASLILGQWLARGQRRKPDKYPWRFVVTPNNRRPHGICVHSCAYSAAHTLMCVW